MLKEVKSVADIKDNGDDVLVYVVFAIVFAFIYIPVMVALIFTPPGVAVSIGYYIVIGGISGLTLGIPVGFRAKEYYVDKKLTELTHIVKKQTK
jgi:hypothetical protein